jgi:hypothetical protein
VKNKTLLPQKDSTIYLKIKLQHAVERFREYRQVWCSDPSDLGNSFSKMKESLEYIDIIKETRMKRIKRAIPPLFSQVNEMIADYDLSEDRFKASGDLLKKYNDVFDKALKITSIKEIKYTLQTMPEDFVPQYPKVQ